MLLFSHGIASESLQNWRPDTLSTNKVMTKITVIMSVPGRNAIWHVQIALLIKLMFNGIEPGIIVCRICIDYKNIIMALICVDKLYHCAWIYHGKRGFAIMVNYCLVQHWFKFPMHSFVNFRRLSTLYL